MTLGRTTENKIKIKTEEGTTRAVNCACCGCICNYGGTKKLKFQNLIGATIIGDHEYYCFQYPSGFSVYIMQAPISTGGFLVLNIVCDGQQKYILIAATSTDPIVSCGYPAGQQLSVNPDYPLLGTWTNSPEFCGFYEPCPEEPDPGCFIQVDCDSVGCIGFTVDIVESND